MQPECEVVVKAAPEGSKPLSAFPLSAVTKGALASQGIVVLFPHLDKLGGAQPGGFNLTKQDCFDGYGFEGEGYDTKQGHQMRAIARMIEQISGVDML